MYLISKDYQLWLKWKESLSKMMESKAWQPSGEFRLVGA
jgi:hypothetical protein